MTHTMTPLGATLANQGQPLVICAVTHPTDKHWTTCECNQDAQAAMIRRSGGACQRLEGRTAKLCNDILIFQQRQGESLSEAWTRFKDLLQKVPHHGIDLWLQVKIFYDHVNPAIRRTIDQSVDGKLRDRNAKESWALLEDLTLYDNKILKAITDRMTGALPSDTVKNLKLNVNSTSPVLSALSYPTEDPQCSARIHSSINAITISMNDFTKEGQEDEGNTTIAESEVGYFDTFSTRSELAYHKLYLMRRSLEVLRKFHWMILRGRFNQLSHVSSPLLSKLGEY
ncbi:hypothetical protein Tco_0025173 [Tanacetum coccineum]